MFQRDSLRSSNFLVMEMKLSVERGLEEAMLRVMDTMSLKELLSDSMPALPRQS